MRPPAYPYGFARRDSHVDIDDVLLDLDGLLVEEEVVGRRQKVVVYAAAQLLDLLDHGGRDPKFQEPLERRDLRAAQRVGRRAG
eukprot:scaffold11041_cov69-Phaeocystis_antarctica.AAC.6